MPSLADLIESANTGADAIQKAPIVEENTGVRCLRIGDVSQRKPFQEWGFTNAKPDIVERFQLKKGDIIIARTGNTIGVNKFIRKDLRSVFNNGLIRLRVNTRSTEPEFIYYNLQTDTFREFIRSIAFGTSTQPNMQIKDMLRYEVANIAKKEQKAIVYILRTLDDKIELNQQMNETLEAMAQALFKSWFVNFDGVAPEDMRESEMGLIPKGWRVGQLRDVCTVIGGFAFKSKDFSTEGHPVVKIKNISNSLDVDLLDVDYVSIEIASKASKFHLEDGSLVMAMTGATVGKFGLVLNQSKLMPVLNQRVALFKPKENGIGFLLSALLTTNIYDQVVLRAQGSAQPNISADGIMDSELILPAKEAQIVFSKITNPLFERWIVNKKESLVLEKVRDTLLPKLISGQLRIKDAEKFLESHI